MALNGVLEAVKILELHSCTKTFLVWILILTKYLDLVHQYVTDIPQKENIVFGRVETVLYEVKGPELVSYVECTLGSSVLHMSVAAALNLYSSPEASSSYTGQVNTIWRLKACCIYVHQALKLVLCLQYTSCGKQALV